MILKTKNKDLLKQISKVTFCFALSVFLFFLILTTALASGSSYIPCYHHSKCECFIQEGDEGNFVKAIINQLINKKYLPKGFSPKLKFTAEVTKAVKQFQTENNLEPTGTMNDDNPNQNLQLSVR